MKLLYILNVAKRVNNFSYTAMQAAKALGIEFHIAGNWSYASDDERIADEEKHGIHIHQIDFIRTPYHPKNKKAYKQLTQLAETEKYDVIHCNTPIGGVLGRLVGKKCEVKTVIYQVHGFHFYKGAPIKNWLLYYPVEKWLSRYTDALITINQEDYERAQRWRFRNDGKTYYVPGVGIDLDAFYETLTTDRDQKREALGVPKNAFVLVSVGELNKNKNNRVVLSAMANAGENVHYVLCGVGDEEKNLRRQARQLGIEAQVHFLGYRTDVKDIYAMADCFVMPSYREGLSRSIMEAMAAGLPCVVSNIRGNVDMVDNSKGGFLCEADRVQDWKNCILTLRDDPSLLREMGEYNLEKVKAFSTTIVEQEMLQIYRLIATK